MSSNPKPESGDLGSVEVVARSKTLSKPAVSEAAARRPALDLKLPSRQNKPATGRTAAASSRDVSPQPRTPSEASQKSEPITATLSAAFGDVRVVSQSPKAEDTEEPSPDTLEGTPSVGEPFAYSSTKALNIAKDIKALLEGRMAWNLKREVKEAVADKLNDFVDLVVRLSEALDTSAVETHKVKTKAAQDAEHKERQYSAKLETFARANKELSEKMIELNKEMFAVRLLVTHELTDQIKDTHIDIKFLRNFLERPRTQDSPKHIVDLTREVSNLRDTIITGVTDQSPNVAEQICDLKKKLTAEAILRGKNLSAQLSDQLVRLTDRISDLTEISEAVDRKRYKQHSKLSDSLAQEIVSLKEAIASVAYTQCPDSDTGPRLDMIQKEVEALRLTITNTTKADPVVSDEITGHIRELRALVEQIKEERRNARAVQQAPTTIAVSSPLTQDNRRRSWQVTEPNRSYAVVVQSKNPSHTSQDIISKIKDKVDVVALGIGVTTVRKVRNQKVVVGCGSESDRKTLEKTITDNLAYDLSTTRTEPKNPRLRLVGVLSDFDCGKMEQAVRRQNKGLLDGLDESKNPIRMIRTLKGRNPIVMNVVVEVTPEVYSRMVNQKIHLGYQIVPVLDQSPVVQCYRCMGYGHFARDCEVDPTCGYCAEGHNTRECKNRLLSADCANCRKANATDCAHPAYSYSCPLWMKWDRIARSSTRYP